MRMAAVVNRCTRRGSTHEGLRSKRVHTSLSAEEVSGFDRLRRLIGMSRSQAVRFLILKEIAFAMGRRQSARTSVCGMGEVHKRAGAQARTEKRSEDANSNSNDGRA